jgi:centrin-1
MLYFITRFQSDKDSKEDIQKVFQLFDDTNQGAITLDHLKRVARELGEEMTEVTT